MTRSPGNTRTSNYDIGVIVRCLTCTGRLLSGPSKPRFASLLWKSGRGAHLHPVGAAAHPCGGTEGAAWTTAHPRLAQLPRSGIVKL